MNLKIKMANLAAISSWDLIKIKKDLIKTDLECSERGLLHSANWATELSFALDQVKHKDVITVGTEPEMDFLRELDQYYRAKRCFDLREYDRAAFFTEDCISHKAHFLHLYSKYLSGEKKANDDLPDSIATTGADTLKNASLKTLRTQLHKDHANKKLDGYSLYLFGVVLKKLDLLQEALVVFTEAVHLEPLLWCAWLELANIISDKDTLNCMSLPDHWMKHFFLGCTYLELQLNEEALSIYQAIRDIGFNKSTYVMAQIAIAFHNMRDVDQAIEMFQELEKVDPFRLDDMDTYSNLLYVKEMRVELSYLAHHACEIDKYRVETCCVIGNYYSLRSQHEKAVLYFQRALKLNPHYLSAWTLMGHEFMEMKNTSAAIQAYRQAIEVNRRDYRAWYGLGQTYEILKMPYYCLYYYRQAQRLRPNDSRMLVALGEAYEKLEKLQEAKKCFWKAHSVGDVEGIALIKLAKLFENLHEENEAAAAHTEYILEAERQGIKDREEQCSSYRFLANYHLKHNRLEEACRYAQKCTEYNETREEGKALLTQIAQQRSQVDNSMIIEDGSVSATGRSRFLPRVDSPSRRVSPINLTFTP